MKTAYGMGYSRARLRTLALALGTAALLAACFGGGDDDGPAPYSIETATTPPDSAGASSQGFADFIVAMAAASLDGREPFDVESLSLPASSETAEPAPTSIDQ